MTHEYAMSRVRDVLKACDGNHLKAQRKVLSMLEKDHTMLLGLVAPHINAIVSHAVNHAAASPKKALPITQIDLENTEESGEFGAALVKGMRGGKEFGDAGPPSGRPGKASQKHIDAINAIAGAAGKTSGKSKKDK